MTWEEKIESLVTLAKAAGRYINSREEQGTDYNNEAMFNLRQAYDAFCDWRHDEPYIVDEIKKLLIVSVQKGEGVAKFSIRDALQDLLEKHRPPGKPESGDQSEKE